MAGTNQTIGGGGFHHLAIRCKDIDASAKFYTEVLGFKFKIGWGEKPKRVMLFDTGDGAYFELFERPDSKPATDEGTLLHVALRTTDCKAAMERVKKAGCEITMELTDLPLASTQGPTTIRIGFFKGPDGELIEFFEHDIT